VRTADLKLETEINFLQAPSMFAWSADSRLLAVSTSDRMVSLYDLPRHRFVSHLPCPGLGTGELTFVGSEGWLAIRGSGTTLRLLSSALGREELVLDSFGASDLATVPGSNSFVTASVEGGLIRWQLQPPVGFNVLPPSLPDLSAATFNANCFDFSPDGRWVVSTHGRYSLLREVPTGHLVDEEDAGEVPGINFETVTFSDAGQFLVRCSSLFGVRRQRLKLDSENRLHFDALSTLDDEKGFFLTDHSPDGRRLALVAPEFGRVKYLEMQGDRIVKRRIWEIPDAYCAALDPTGQRLLVNGGGSETNASLQFLSLISIQEGVPLTKVLGRPFGEVAWSADGRVVLTSNDPEHSRVWDPRTWQSRAELTGALGGNITTFALAPGGEFAVIARDETLSLVSTQDGHLIARWESPEASGLAAGIRFLPDQRRFAVLWRDGRIDLMDPDAFRQGLRPLGLDW
jgi:WD40 repeat protein